MKVAVIGSGGREHAIAWSLRQADPARRIYLLPGNGGTEVNLPIPVTSVDAVVEHCRLERVDLVIVGPENPLAAGVIDRLRAVGVPALGPTKEAARLESSKIFAKRFMQRHGVATGEFWVYEHGEDPADRLRELQGRLVLKYDGLAAGKGVWVCGSEQEAQDAVLQLRKRYGKNAPFLIERRLEGNELSLIGFTDGKDIRLLPACQDHKALRDGDEGPNTGGMGAFAPVSAASPELLAAVDAQIVQPTLAGLAADELDYRGVLFFGLMVTAEGPRLLEYNVRLGDPETQILLPLLDSDLADVALATVHGEVSRLSVRLRREHTVGVVLASEGYPADSRLGVPIQGLDRTSEGVFVFHSGTRAAGSRIVTAGGRVLTVVARELSLVGARERAYAACKDIAFEGMQYRKDIGRRPWK